MGWNARFATISNDCSSGTPAFIMVANWRVKSVMSLSVIFLPLEKVFFLTLVTRMPWRRKAVALTNASPPRAFHL